MKDVYVLSCYTKLPCQDDLIEVFDKEEEAFQALLVIQDFSEKQSTGYKLCHPFFDCGYTVDYLVRKVPMSDNAYEQMVEANNRLLSSASIKEYWNGYKPYGKSEGPVIKDFIPYEFL